MRLPLVVGVGAMTSGMLLMAGFLGPGLRPMPLVNVDAIELDGAPLLSAPLAQVSPRPTLVVRLSQPLDPRQWQLSLDGHTLAA